MDLKASLNRNSVRVIWLRSSVVILLITGAFNGLFANSHTLPAVRYSSLGVTRSISPQQSQTPSTVCIPVCQAPKPPATPDKSKMDFGPDPASQVVKLYYLREATKLVALLNAIAKSDPPSELTGLLIGNVSENEIILYGSKEGRDHARRLIAALDLPRPGIRMDMWGIQISSRNAKAMADVMPLIRAKIEETQQAVRDTYHLLEASVRTKVRDCDLDSQFKDLLEKEFSYRTALDQNRPLSFTDMLLRLVASRRPAQTTVDVANDFIQALRDSRHHSYLAEFYESQKRNTSQSKRLKTDKTTKPDMDQSQNPPFYRFFHNRGLNYGKDGWVPRYDINRNGEQARVALLYFALNYGLVIHKPKDFDPYYLQHSAETLNSRLQDAIDALNLDIEEMFVAPTLARIREIVRKFDDVEYAQVGNTSIASLSGIPTEVTSHSVNAFDVTPPLRLSELLEKAKTLSDSAGTFVPKPTENLVGAMPLAQVIGLIGAFGEERSVWRELQSGISLNITPNVLRNMVSAELEINLRTGDPQAGTREQGVRPLTRVSQHDLKTKVYVDAFDFFDLSAFASQSTLNGERGYVPIIGPVWRGLFQPIPIVGDLFSWKRSPQTVFSESLILTTSFITPTVMGVAVLYPTQNKDLEKKAEPWKKIEDYSKRLPTEPATDPQCP